MIKISIDKAASKKLLNFAKNGDVLIEKAIKNAIRMVGLKTQNYAKKNAPVKSGNLRRSITGNQQGNTYIIGTNLIYAPVHEFGAVIMPKKNRFLVWRENNSLIFASRVKIPKYKGRGYFAPALKSIESEASEIFSKEILKAIK